MDRPLQFEPMPLIERYIGWVSGLEIGGNVVPVTPSQRVLEKQGAVSPALMSRVYADEREVPVRFAWMIGRQFFQDGRNLGSPIFR